MWSCHLFFYTKKEKKKKVQLHVQNTSNVIDWINKVQFGRLTLQGFGPSYNPCKKGKYKASVLVIFYQN